MRPHLLELIAFGAFPREVMLNFDALGANGLVLLCGETGGGKTTLLDALGFALFGRVPGLRGDLAGGPDLRSHHAPPDVGPWVRLTFSLSGARYRVTREPAWDRPKKRAGDGTVRVNARALLEEHTREGWRPVAGRPQDVGHELGLLIGMTAEQFFQVVMLPQGRFAAFLHADHAHRQELLRTLFGLDRFELAEQWLTDSAKRAGEAVNVARSALSRVAAKVGQAAGVEPPADPELEPAWASTISIAARADADTCAQRAANAALARRCADNELDRAQQFAQRQRQRRVVAAREAELAAAEEGLKLVEIELDAARRAAVVHTALTEVTARRGAAERDAAHRDKVRRRLVKLGETREAGEPRQLSEPRAAGESGESGGFGRSGGTGRSGEAGDGTRPGDGARLDAEAYAAQARRLRGEAGQLGGLAAQLSSAEAAEADARAADTQAERLAAEATEFERQRDVVLPARRAELEGSLDAARRAHQLLGPIREQLRLAGDLARVLRDHAVAARAADDAEARTRVAKQTAVDLRRQRFEAITAELAAGLESDTPCPVCGSLNHPDPTEARADHVSKDDELATEAAAGQLAAAEAEARSRADRLDERQAALGEDLRAATAATLDLAHASEIGLGITSAEFEVDADADSDDPQVRATALKGASARLRVVAGKLERAAAGLAELDRALTDLATQEVATTAGAAERQAQRRAAVEAASAARLRAADARAHLPADVTDLATLEACKRRYEVLAEAYDQAHASMLAAQGSAAELTRALEAARTQAVANGFADAEAARTAVRDDAWTTESTRRLREHRDELVAVRARLADQDLAVDLSVDAGVSAREATAAAARVEHDRAVGELAVAQRRADQLAALVDEFGRAVAALAPLRCAANERSGLAELVTGRGSANRQNMPLSSFVLAARLEQVADAASRRLSAMSAGRFTLALDHTGPRDGRRKAGLDLLVEDAWTGRRRAPVTLSGGETFQAALSLALGLADVVTSEAGGRTMDTLFIDEGFGTLDPDSLDEVMDVLDELRSGGRLVGVVSHVAELRQRIPSQIQVVKDARGSTVRTTV